MSRNEYKRYIISWNWANYLHLSCLISCFTTISFDWFAKGLSKIHIVLALNSSLSILSLSKHKKWNDLKSCNEIHSTSCETIRPYLIEAPSSILISLMVLKFQIGSNTNCCSFSNIICELNCNRGSACWIGPSWP